MSEVVSSPGIRLPAIIGRETRRGVESLQWGLSFILRRLIKALIGGDGIVSHLVVDLADGSGGSLSMELLATTSMTRKKATVARKGATVVMAIWKSTATGIIETAIILARNARILGSDMSSGI